jgi:hypothetical protein
LCINVKSSNSSFIISTMISFPYLEFCHMTTSRTLDLRMYIKPIQAYYQYGLGSHPALYIKKGCTRLVAQGMKFTSCLPMVGGSLRVLRLPPPLKLVATVLVIGLYELLDAAT